MDQKIYDVGPGLKAAVRSERPEVDDPQRLAIEMAGVYNDAAAAQGNYDALRAAASGELSKARELKNVLFVLQQREREGFIPKSRMDRYAQYKKGDVEKQLDLLKSNAVNLQGQADEQAQLANSSRQKAARLQKQIQKAIAARAAADLAIERARQQL